MLRRLRSLRRAGVLGLNDRNRNYVMRFNPRAKFPLVDDKLETKKLATAAGIRVPELYGVVRFQGELTHLDRLLEGTGMKPRRHSEADSAGRDTGLTEADLGDGSVAPIVHVAEAYHCRTAVSIAAEHSASAPSGVPARLTASGQTAKS